MLLVMKSKLKSIGCDFFARLTIDATSNKQKEAEVWRQGGAVALMRRRQRQSARYVKKERLLLLAKKVKGSKMRTVIWGRSLPAFQNRRQTETFPARLPKSSLSPDRSWLDGVH